MNQIEPDPIHVSRALWERALELLHAVTADADPCDLASDGQCQAHPYDVIDDEGRYQCVSAEVRRLFRKIGIEPHPAEFTPPRPQPLSRGLSQIIAERLRQIELGHVGERDAERNPRGELGCAAAALATHPDIRIGVLGNTWPWAVETWPGDGPNGPGISRREELIRAGALIAAELDRLDAARPERNLTGLAMEEDTVPSKGPGGWQGPAAGPDLRRARSTGEVRPLTEGES